jgi:uncharacterized protein
MSNTNLENPLPRYIDPWRFAQQGTSLKGQLAVSLLPRLGELLSDSSGIINADVSFFVDEQGLRCLSGQLTAVY